MKRFVIMGLACMMVVSLSAQIDTDWSHRVRESRQNARGI